MELVAKDLISCQNVDFIMHKAFYLSQMKVNFQTITGLSFLVIIHHLHTFRINIILFIY